jgi:putative (di)nucleoside polyphosphate hydrolase
MPDTEMKYRANVAAILRNAKGEILICERLGMPGAWQFPQGGVDEGESLDQALLRELSEEIGLVPDDLTIVEHKGPYRYVFGNGRTKKGYHGKEQHYFLADFSAPDSRINVATEHPEFQAFRWIAPEKFDLNWLPEMKRDVYRKVFKDFFGIKM